MSINIGAFLQGGAGGYKFARDMKDQEAEAERKKKIGDRADLTWQREEDFRSSLNPASPPAAGGISVAGQASAIAPSGESAPRNIAAQGITPPAPQGTTQPAQPAWEERARQLLEKERQSLLLPDGGVRFKPFFESDKKRLMSEATQGLLQPGEDGSISSKAAQNYANQFRSAASKLGIVPTPEEVMQAAKIAKTLKDEGIEEAATAFRKGDIDEANRLGAQGNLNWKLTNQRQVKLPNGAIVWAADNIRPDGSKSTMNSYEVDKRLLERAAGLNFMLAEQKAATDAINAKTKARGGITFAQQKINYEIESARKHIAGLSPGEIKKRTQQYSATGRENPDYDPLLAAKVRQANRRKYGIDPHFDTSPDNQDEDQPDITARFSTDPVMKGHRLGNETPQGVEVFDASGKLIGHYN